MLREASSSGSFVDRPDPENRTFTHPDPIGWTGGSRAEILAALYTISLGNPMLLCPRDAPCRTRFKMWWRVVGSAIEHAARLNKQAVDFEKLFAGSEEDEEETTSLAEALKAMSEEWPMNALSVTKFKASAVADLINDQQSNPNSPNLRAFLFGDQPPAFRASIASVGKRLKQHVDNPVKHGNDIMTLKADINRVGVTEFWVNN